MPNLSIDRRLLPRRDRRDVSLSPREREVARLVAGGYTNAEIADVLGISAWTVATHLRRVFGKLNVHSRAHMVAELIEAKLL